MTKAKKKLGEMLMEAGLIDRTQLESSLSYQRQWGGRIGSILIRRGFVTEQDIILVITRQLGIECISLREIVRPSDEVLSLVKADFAAKYEFFPLRLEGKTLVIAISDPTDLKTLDDISFNLGFKIKPVLALESDILNAIAHYYEGRSIHGKSYTIDKERMIESFGGLTSSDIVDQHKKSAPPDKTTEQKDSPSGKEISQKAILESLIDLLTAKGIFTKEELINHIRSKRRP